MNHSSLSPYLAFLREFWAKLFASKTPTPEELLLRGFKASCPGWEKDGLLKKPH